MDKNIQTNISPEDMSTFAVSSAEEISTESEHHSHNTSEHHTHSHHHNHHHRAHSHRHGHHRHSRNNKKKNNKFIKFIKKNKSVLINIVACSVSVILIILMALGYDNSFGNTEKQSSYVNITQSSIKIESSIYLEDVPLVSQAILDYVDSDNERTVIEIYKSYNGYKNQLNIGLPLKYTYSIVGLPSNISVKNALFELSESNDYSNAQEYSVDVDDSSVEIYHLKTGTRYYYRLNLTLSNGSIVGTTGDFTTAKTPRILNIDGAVNVRDIGGWDTENGSRIRQGLLYRGSELDGVVEPEYCLTDKGQNDMLSVLGIRFDMDLRSPKDNNGKDALGSNVQHKYYAVCQYSDIFKEENQSNIREVFSDLADKNNYPVYLHCTYGRDRTGTICYLLEALLGVSEEDLYHDYEISALTDSYVNTQEFEKLIVRIDMLDGATTKEKVENYLLSIGVTAHEISSIREIFLEK